MAAAERATRGVMAGGMARITLSMAGRATATAAVMHQFGYRHRLSERLATMLADAGFQ